MTSCLHSWATIPLVLAVLSATGLKERIMVLQQILSFIEVDSLTFQS